MHILMDTENDIHIQRVGLLWCLFIVPLKNKQAIKSWAICLMHLCLYMRRECLSSFGEPKSMLWLCDKSLTWHTNQIRAQTFTRQGPRKQRTGWKEISTMLRIKSTLRWVKFCALCVFAQLHILQGNLQCGSEQLV